MIKHAFAITSVVLGMWFIPTQASQTISLKNESLKRSHMALLLIKKAQGTHNNLSRRTHLYLKARDLLQPGDSHTVKAQAFIGLGDSGYTDSFTKEAYLWYVEALDLLKGTSCSDFSLKMHLYKALSKAGYTDRLHRLPCDWLSEALVLSQTKEDKIDLLFELRRYFKHVGNTLAAQNATLAAQELLRSL